MSVSVVIPAYRAAATVTRAVRSCLASVDPRDVVVVLDGPDAELEAASRSCPGVQVIVRPERTGAPACRNAGLALARTDHVMFLDADDYVEGPLFEDALRVAREAQADLVLGAFAFEWPTGAREARRPADLYGAPDNDVILARWLATRYTPPCAVVWRAAFVRALGGWDEGLAKNQDGDIVYRALMAHARVAFGNEGVGVYVQGDDPGRITNQQTPRAIESQFTVLEKIRMRLPVLSNEVGPALAFAYYTLARHAYTAHHDALGRRAELIARDLGLRGEPGDFTHTMLASMLGLRGKQHLTHLLRNALSA